MNIEEFALKLRIICELHDASVIDWIASEKRNSELGRKPTAQHRQGLGADLLFDDSSSVEPAARTATKLGLFHKALGFSLLTVQAAPDPPNMPPNFGE